MGQSRKVAQYRLDGTLVLTWDSVSDAATHLGLSKSGITKAASGLTLKCGGFRWLYFVDAAEEYIGDTQDEFLYGIVTAGLEYLGRWRTIREAARALSLDSSMVCKIVNGKKFSWDGVMFVWAETVDDARVKCINRATARMNK